MKEKELIKLIIRKYEEAQQISHELKPDQRIGLKRGNKHTISSFLEDAVAAFVYDLLDKDKFECWVNQTFRPKGSSKQWCPDIAIVKKNPNESYTLVRILEVKDSPNPFRWNAKKTDNKSLEYVNERLQLLKQYKKVILSYVEPTNGTRKELDVSKNIEMDLVLISGELFQDIKLKALEHHCSDKPIHLHVLLQSHHPNCKGKKISPNQLIEAIENNSKEITYQEESLRNSIKRLTPSP